MPQKLEDKLRELGTAVDVEAFEQAIGDVFDRDYPHWTDEELFFHSWEALKFWESVLRQLKERGNSDVDVIPVELVNRTLSNMRKQSRIIRERRKPRPMPVDRGH